VTTTRSSQRRLARLGAIVVVTGASISALTVETASATATTLEPQVQIGESRAIERSTPTVTVSAADGHDDGVSVAVAGVALARAAPPVNRRFESDLADNGTKALVLLAGALCAASATAAALRYFSRRIVP
jgi:hypothetical protein